MAHLPHDITFCHRTPNLASKTVLHYISWLHSGSGSASGLQLAACDNLMEDLLKDVAFPQTPNEDETFQQEEAELMGPKNKKLTWYLHNWEQELFACWSTIKRAG